MENINIDLIKNEYKKIVFELLLQLKEHSEESFLHSIDVANKALFLATVLKVPEEDLQTLYTASLLHDIGKTCIDKELLHKTNASELEKDLIRVFHIDGTKTILSQHFDEDIVKLASHHHERLNNSGYPEHLNAKSLDILDRILQVSDVTSALAMNRCYQEAFSPKRIIEILDNLVHRGELDKKCVHQIEKMFFDTLKDQPQPEL